MYLIGVIVFFILAVFFIALIHNEKLRENCDWIAAQYIIFKHCSEIEYTIIFFMVILWPVTLIAAFMFGLGYCLFKIFSKLIDYFVK